MSLCTLAQLKARQGITTSSQDTLLTAILTGVSGQLSAAADRPARGGLAKTTTTRTLSVREPGVSILYLRHWPIVTVTQVKEAMFKAFGDATALVEDTDFMVDYERGELIRMGFWLKGGLTVQLTYTGGYTVPDDYSTWATGSAYVVDDLVLHEGAIYICIDAIDPSNTAPPDDEDHWTATLQQPMPDDIVEVCIQQAQFTYQRRDALGLTAAGAQGGSFSAYAQDKLLPGVADTMRECGYKRMIG